MVQQKLSQVQQQDYVTAAFNQLTATDTQLLAWPTSKSSLLRLRVVGCRYVLTAAVSVLAQAHHRAQLER